MKIACIDTETTGLNKNTDRIIQLSCKVFDSETGERLDSLNEYILPSGMWKINPDAQAVHNISEEFIKEHIEEKYQVRLKDCEWMTLETLSERIYNMEGGV